jgi:inorganic pyrophosphatase
MTQRFMSVLTIGSNFSKRIFLLENSNKISPWHDIKLFGHPNRYTFPAVIEISRHNIAKYEVCLNEAYNPIKQDTLVNKNTGETELRYYARFPLFNYGMLPQTWENPYEKDSVLGLKGDGDPLDIIEIGSNPISCGSLLDVKVLGALCLIDQNEIDWKILCINVIDPLIKKINNPNDIEKHFPGKIGAIIDWLENIKVFDGKSKNKVEGTVQGPEVALSVIIEAHSHWKTLVSGAYPQAEFWSNSILKQS